MTSPEIKLEQLKEDVRMEAGWIRDHLRDLGKMLEKTEDEFSKKITEMQDIVGDARENLNKITGMTYED